LGDFSWPEAILEGILEGKWQCSADEISFLDKVDGGEVVHQLEMVFVQCGRNQRQEVCAGSASKGQGIVLLMINKEVLLTSLNLDEAGKLGSFSSTTAPLLFFWLRRFP